MPPGRNPSRAVLLLSGGLDSTTLLALARHENFEVHALTFAYGQRHAAEVRRARKIAQKYQVASHQVIEMDLRAMGGSALTSEAIPVPHGRSAAEMAAGIPDTYVPARNTIFLAYALAVAEVRGAAEIFIGVNAVDYSGYPDCRPEFIAAFQELARLATRDAVEGGSGIHVNAPLLHMSKREIIETGTRLGVDYGLTISCYDPSDDDVSCGTCDACQLRLRGFADAGISDPARYAGQAAVR